jgi:hypothetical protein
MKGETTIIDETIQCPCCECGVIRKVWSRGEDGWAFLEDSRDCNVCGYAGQATAANTAPKTTEVTQCE